MDDNNQDDKQNTPTQGVDNQPDNSPEDSKAGNNINLEGEVGYDQEPPTDPDKPVVNSEEDTVLGEGSFNEPPSEGSESPFGPPIENIGSVSNTTTSKKIVDVVQAPENEFMKSKPVMTAAADSDLEIETKNEAASALLQPAPAEAPAPQADTAEPVKKRRLTGLITAIVVVVLLAGAAALGYFVVKNNADTAADEYVVAANGYIDEVHGLTSQPLDNPSALRTQISAIDRPVLQDAFLSELSSKYSDAEQMQENVVSAVGLIALRLEEMETFSEVQKFVEYYTETTLEGQAILTELTTNSTDEQKTAAYTGYIAHLESLKEDVDAITLPTEVSADGLSLSGALEEEIVIYEARLAAATDAAVTTPQDEEELAAITSARNEAFAAIESYSEDMTTDMQIAKDGVRQAVAELRSYKRA